MEEARLLARAASTRVQAYFPMWNVQAKACADAPAWAVIKKADAWQSDLIVVGSHDRSTLGSFLLGSVSQIVSTVARCTVRVARGRREDCIAPARIIIEVDGSPNANAAVRTVAERVWPPGSEARVIAVLSPRSRASVASRWRVFSNASCSLRWRLRFFLSIAPRFSMRWEGLASVIRKADTLYHNRD